MFLLLLIIIIDELYSLTKFAYDYNSNYDYGQMLKEICKTNYTEYETHRFQLMNNIDDIRIKNDQYSTHMDFMVVLASLIAAIAISLKFAFVFNPKLDEYLDTSNFTDFLNLFKKDNLIWRIFYIFKFLFMVYIIFIIPIYVIVMFAKDHSMSPFLFRDDENKNYDISSIAIQSFIFVVMLILLFIDNDNNNNNNNDKNTFLIKISMFAAFVLAYYYVTMFVKKFWDQNKNTDNIHQQYITDLKSNDHNDINIGLKYLNSIFGRNPDPNKNDYKTPLSVIGIFVAVVAVICLFLILVFYTISKNYEDDIITLLQYVLLPYILILFMVIAVIACKEYNTYVNKYLLYNPYISYTGFLKKINTIFNKILENDKANVEKHSICRNVVNATHMFIYSDLFGSISYDKLFVPEFTYSSICDNSEYIEYNKLTEYNIDGQDKIFFEDQPCKIQNDVLSAVMQQFAIQTEIDKDVIKRKLKFCIINILKNLTYNGKKVLKFTNDFEYNNIIVRIDNISKVLPAFTKKQEYLLEVIDHVTDEYVTYKTEMYKETMNIIKALCECNDIQDITNVKYDADTFKQKIKDNNDNFNKTYSVNLKKEYIDKFMRRTKQLMISINDYMTTHISVHNKNYKLAQLIIRNYNLMQTDEYSKHKLLKLIEKDFKPIQDKVGYYDDMKDIEESIDKLIVFVNEHNNTSTDANRKSVILIELNDELANLAKLKKEYEDKNKKKPVSYYDKLIYEYKIEYIDKSYYNFNQYNEKRRIITTDMKTKYDTFKGNYETQYDNASKIWKDDPSGMEDIPKANALDLARNTSSTIYILFIIYLVLIILLIILHKMH